MATIRSATILFSLLAISGCIDNTAPGNDREADLDPPAPAAEMATAESALQNVDVGLLMPEILSDADVRAAGPLAGGCLFRMTRVGFPVLLFSQAEPGEAVIKLNGKLISLSSAGPGQYSGGPVSASVRTLESDSPGLQQAEFIVRIADAPSELGFRGFRECGGRA